jgi:xylan 1,4-beta-xylosidase
LTAYIDMGLPTDLSASQLAELQAATTDQPERDTLVTVGNDGAIDLDQTMRSNDVVLLILDRSDN